jgi:ferric-dicitrate binding protein FerR (iron transport regulator)
MGRFLRVLTRRKVIAAAVGALLAGAPLVVFDFWLGGLIQQQGQLEVATATRRAVLLADPRLDQAIATLEALVGSGG